MTQKQPPPLSWPIWILAAGRLLSQIGTGFTLFYAPIFFVNQVGFSATAVGIALGSQSVSGVLGRFLGGMFVDSPQWGRRKTLLLSAAISALADVFLAATYNYPTLLIGNLLMGLGIGFYWPATEAAVADLTTREQRNEAYAITRLADTVGLGLGTVIGGTLITFAGNYRLLFILDGVSFVVFFGIIYFAIQETYNFAAQSETMTQGWQKAFRDRALMVYVAVNILFTTYISQTQSTLPLYFSNFANPPEGEGFAAQTISILIAFHIVFAAICQLPLARFLNRFSRPHALIFSQLLWGVGFLGIGLTGQIRSGTIIAAIAALIFLSLGMIAYTPSASSLVADLAPESLRGVYLSINSQCWAIGYFIGPMFGGWAMDQSPPVAHGFWVILAISTAVGTGILLYLQRLMRVES
ncbi:MFS transporter [Spirulina sp. CS-785/01]|uniref:MDR family MFS transporter n=1 Tax=Spirulina sp. CS-785/01 TaxID=3021716 RepID=UPI00233086C2|nr:MFS transporter [Spirulina sp. CS-785/01]MDB9311989.1 MFS transporter [Spirulina sp. CS-785/01]